MQMSLKAIGTIRTPFETSEGVPVQPRFAGSELKGTVELFEEYAPALKDLDGFERIWLVFWMHKSSSFKLLVKPYMDDEQHGLFATRAPSRPNPIGISCVKLDGVEGSCLKVSEIDILNGTPLLDIKPYYPRFDSFEGCVSGWLDRTEERKGIADRRFEK